MEKANFGVLRQSHGSVGRTFPMNYGVAEGGPGLKMGFPLPLWIWQKSDWPSTLGALRIAPYSIVVREAAVINTARKLIIRLHGK